MLIRVGYEIKLACKQPTPLICLMSVHPDTRGRLLAPEETSMDPMVPVQSYIDSFDNICRRLVAPAGGITLRSDAVIHDSGKPDPVYRTAEEWEVGRLPDDTLRFLLGSRYVETDLLSQTAWDMFGSVNPGWDRVEAIVAFVHDHLRFDYQSARATRTAVEAYRERVGVCRDFAHLALGFLRAMNIPARYVNGYLGDIGVPPVPDPMDFSAWIEVFLGGEWHSFDPRHNARRIGRVVVARGRDAADVPLINSFGLHGLTQFRVWTDEVKDAPQGTVTPSFPSSPIASAPGDPARSGRCPTEAG
ncbi:MAG TPA: transglutaminase family protein [Albidovulum sp.]|uniref:transglutaminase-like domain-containing protein n=1 Tax=Albidovulum sp. TaxID=1872424 RepID=UPI002D18D7EE|nr:transglutaminase family protein [Albidovulum sp.]